MKTSAVILSAVVSIAGLLAGSAANAAGLDGAWALNLEVCSKVFEKKGNRISIAKNSDIFGSGFIIDGNRIRGKVATCTIKSRKEEAGVVHLITSCSTDVALSTMQFSFKLDGENRMTRLFPGVPELATSYARCPL